MPEPAGKWENAVTVIRMNLNRRPGWEEVSDAEEEWDPEEEWEEVLVWQLRGLTGGEKEEELAGARADFPRNI